MSGEEAVGDIVTQLSDIIEGNISLSHAAPLQTIPTKFNDTHGLFYSGHLIDIQIVEFEL